MSTVYEGHIFCVVSITKGVMVNGTSATKIQQAFQNMGNFQAMFRNGSTGEVANTTLTQKVLGWIAFFIVIMIMLYVLYLLYKTIFSGYSRTLNDFFRFNMSHKVDVKDEFASKKSTLYNALSYFAEENNTDKELLKQLGVSFEVFGECQSELCDDVFLNFINVIDNFYQPEFTDNKLVQALADYISYHDKITKDLNLKFLSTEQRIQKINFILDGINNYMDKYAEITNQESAIVCKLNDKKDEASRQIFEAERKQMQSRLEEYKTTYGITAVSTDMQFANFFTDPTYIASCGTPFNEIYNKLLSKSKHEDIRKKVKQQLGQIQSFTRLVPLINSKLIEIKKNITDYKTEQEENEIIKKNKPQKVDSGSESFITQNERDKISQEDKNSINTKVTTYVNSIIPEELTSNDVSKIKKELTSDDVSKIKDEIKKIIQELKIQKLENEKQMARIRKVVTQQAREQREQEMKDNNIIVKTQNKQSTLKKLENKIKNDKNIKKIEKAFTKPFKKHNKNKKKEDKKDGVKNDEDKKDKQLKLIDLNTLTYSTEREDSMKVLEFNVDSTNPIVIKRTDKKLNVVYVPCYEAYRHYVNMNVKETTINKLLKEISKDEVIAYLFLKDLNDLQDKNASSAPPFIVRILSMYCAMENIALRVQNIVSGSLRTAINNIMLDTKDNAKLCKLDYGNASFLQAYEQNDFSNITVSRPYTWYVMELWFMSQTQRGDDVFNEVFQRFKSLLAPSGLDFGDQVRLAQRINAFINLKTIKDSSNIIEALDIENTIKDFTLHYPLFCTLYLSSIASLNPMQVKANDFEIATNNVKQVYNMTRFLINSLIDTNNFDEAYDKLTQRMYSLKRFMLYANLTHNYFSQYKQIVIEKNKISQTREEREGYVELYNEQTTDEREFFIKLITPFKKDLLDNRVASAWKRAFYGPRFDKTSKISYWIEFNALWIDTLRPKADKMIKSVWSDVGKSAKLRW